MDRWYLLFTKPRKELQVCHQLTLKELPVYLPLLPPASQGRQARTRATAVSQPLFPRYLFVRLDPLLVGFDTVRWTPGVSNLVSFGEELASVDDEVIAYIRGRVREISLRRDAPLVPGQHVRIRAGHPLAALDAVFERSLSGGARARILIQVLGRLTHAEVDVEALEPIAATIG